MTDNHTQEDIRRGFAQFGALGCVVASVLLGGWLLRAPITALIYSEAARGFDARTMISLHAPPGSTLHNLFFRLTVIGSPIAMWIVCVVGLVWLFPRARPVVIATWIAAFGGSSAISTGLKHIVLRARPEGAEQYLFSMSYSFPSTHTLASLVGYGMLAYVICQFRLPGRARQRLTVLLAAAVISTVAISRLILGVHYATDVVGGLLLGAFWLSACIFLARRNLRPSQAAALAQTSTS
ncbi:MAG: phosphatase PAP2 family protein [Phycisphaerae bacterium]|nr:phosphatase PAP2 family protein [Gemmatimonadaceae bacterium]